MEIDTDTIRTLIAEDSRLTRLVPPRIAEIIRVVGIDAALDVWFRYGGRQVYIPAYVTEATALAEVVGFEAAQKLADHFSDDFGNALFIPGTTGKFFRRFSAIRHLREGHSAKTVARVMGMSGAVVLQLYHDFVAGQAAPPKKASCE